MLPSYLRLLLAALLSVTAISMTYGTRLHHCNVNVTSVSYRTVTKTRQVVSQPQGFFKKFKKPKTQVELYTAQEPVMNWHLENRCCEGYQMSEVGLCQPVCEQGCPQHANCTEPNRCLCDRGYVSAVSTEDGSHYCEPICEVGCPANGHCAAPNKCRCELGYSYNSEQHECLPRCRSNCAPGGVCVAPEVCSCQPGYQSEAGLCKPLCEATDGCRYGRCIAPEQCVCHVGFIKNAVTQLCEPFGVFAEDATTEYVEYENTAGELATEVDMDFDAYTGVYKSGLEFDISSEPSLNDNSSKCSPGFIYYKGQCHAESFSSNEFDCRYKQCTAHARCLENGTCACEDGYVWHKPVLAEEQQIIEYLGSTESPMWSESTETTASAESTTVAFTTQYDESTAQNLDSTSPTYINGAHICISINELNALLNQQPAANAGNNQSNGWWLFLCLGLFSMGLLCAAILLGMRVAGRQRGSLEVKSKNDLCCRYESERIYENPDVY